MSLTPKQEKWCLEFHRTGNGSEAYRIAYDTENMGDNSIYQEANALKENPKITLRLAELKEEDRKRNAVTIDSLTVQLEEAREKAMREGKGASAAVSACMGKAKLHGLLVDRVKITEVPLSEWSEKDIDNRIGTLGKETGVIAPPGGESQTEAGE